VCVCVRVYVCGVWSIYVAESSARQVSALNNSVDVRHVPSVVEKDDGVCVCVCARVCVRMCVCVCILLSRYVVKCCASQIWGGYD